MKAEPLPSVLVVGGDAADGERLAQALRGHGAEGRCARDVEAAVVALDTRRFDVVVLAVQTTQNADVVERILSHCQDIAVVAVCSGVEDAVRAVRAGAHDVVEAPLSEQKLTFALERVRGYRKIRENEPPASRRGTSKLLGESKAMQKVRSMVKRAAKGTATVLIRGESGTGKELVARAIHRASARGNGPFVKIHTAALPDTLLESELFGYERGAFTGATVRKPGRVEVADGGTLFLDEIGEVTPAMQVKLLRLLQEREYEPLGSNQTRKVDVRFVAATHRDLEDMIKQGQFREDLFYRLNVVSLWMPPLRARREDIELLAVRFCEAFAKANGKPGMRLSPDAIAALRAQRWPGNVRELENFVESAVIMSDDEIIAEHHVRDGIQGQTAFSTQSVSAVETDEPSSLLPLDEAVRQTEKRLLLRALERTGHNRTLAARILGVSRATFYKKLGDHGLMVGPEAEAPA